MRLASRALIAAVFLLLALGVVMLFSTSSVSAAQAFDEPQYFLKRQVVWIAIASTICFLVRRIDYHLWQRPAMLLPLAGMSVLLLAMVFVPGIGMKIGGSWRWIGLYFMSFQPSELAKFTVIFIISSWMVKAGRKVRNLREGILIPLGMLGVVLALIFLEPDFGTTLLTAVVGLGIMFAGGVRVLYLAVPACVGLVGFFGAVWMDPVRRERVLAFLWPEKYPEKSYHLLQSLAAIISGGWRGVGLGNSIQKHLYLPEAHTDFIMAIVGEELGFIGTLGVVILFAVILACGMRISSRAPDPFGKLVAFGFTLMLVMQAAINLGVVTGCLPTKGLPLPFISYGGSSLVSALASVAVLLNIASHGEDASDDAHTRWIKDKAHNFSD